MDESEVRVKMGMDASQLRAGLATTREAFKSTMAEIKEAIHPIHDSLKTLREALHGAGIFAAFAAADHLKEIFTKVADFIGGEASHAQQEIDKLNESLKSIKDKMKDVAEKKERIGFDKLTHGGKIDYIENEQDAQREKIAMAQQVAIEESVRANAVKQSLYSQYGKFGTEHDPDLQLRISKADEKAAAAKLVFEQEKLKLVELQADKQKEIAANQKEVDEKEKKDSADDDKEKAAREVELHKLKMFHLSIERAKQQEAESLKNIKNSELNEFLPDHQEILASKWSSRGGSTYAAKMQMNIDAEEKAFKDKRLRGFFAGDEKGVLDETNYIEGMKKQLATYLGGTSQTTEEKIAESTKTSAAHLKDIRDAFYNNN